MFKEGQVYKIKVELSPDLMGFGRAMVVAVDTQRIYVQLRSSKGNKLNVPRGTKIWFVGSSLNNRFNGLWSSEVKGNRMINGSPSLECRLPRFEQASQKRVLTRIELNAPAEMVGDEWKNLIAKVVARNISRFGLGFYVEADCADRFTQGKTVSLLVHIGNIHLPVQGRVVNCGFNWLLNRTEVGAELIQTDGSTVDALEKVLVWLGNKPRGARAESSESGALARWVKAGKDNFKFVKQAGTDSKSAEAEEEGIFELETEFGPGTEDDFDSELLPGDDVDGSPFPEKS
jgi:hypothetical protein